MQHSITQTDPASAHVILDIAEMGLSAQVRMRKKFLTLIKKKSFDTEKSPSFQIKTNATQIPRVIPMQRAMT